MFKILETLYEGTETYIYKAIDENDNKQVIIKVLKSEHPTPQSIARLKYEYDIAKDLDIEGVIKYYDFTKIEHSPALVIEDIGAVSLSDVIEKEKRLNIREFLEISIKIANTLSQIHKKNIIHKDIKSHNIIVNREKSIVRLIDFGIATKNVTEETRKDSKELKGTLLYISPEQTGRTNQKIDSRSDLYSLGVTFYEMITGQLPFESKDIMELIHSHIAVKPKPLVEIDKQIPVILSDIVMKLLSKNPEDRYQSAIGLKYDLERCLAQFEKDGHIKGFAIGEKDVPPYLRLPDRLYGRDKELQLIEEVISGDDSNNKCRLINITGRAGVGKSAIGKEIHNNILNTDYNFSDGNFDKFTQSTPYSGIIKALTKLIKQFLTEADNKALAQMKAKLDKELGENARHLTAILPLLEKIFGKDAKKKEATEVPQTVFINAFQTLFKVFTGNKLIIFLDDFQYVDSATVTLLEKTILKGAVDNLIFIMAYRDDELDESHKWNDVLSKIEDKKSDQLNQLTLENLSYEDINELTADTLFYEDKTETDELAEQIQKKTGGNPYFIERLFKKLYEDGLLYFSDENYKWNWKIEGIRNLNVMDNAVELITEEISKLDTETKTLLNIASCIGNTFDIAILYSLSGRPYTALVQSLNQAISKDIIAPIGDEYKYVTDKLKEKDAEKVNYKFLHNRIQQAFYDLLSEEEKNKYHLKIGRYYLDKSTEDEVSEDIFKIADNLNKAKPLIKNDEEIKELIELNIKASKKANEAVAYETGLKYATEATDIFPEHLWEKENALGIQLYERRARCEGLCVNFEEVEHFLNIAIEHAKTTPDKIRLYSVLTIKHLKTGDFKEAIKVGIDGLREAGIVLPDTEEELDKLQQEEYQKTKEKTKDKRLEDIMKLPELTDEKQKLILRLLGDLHHPANAIRKLHIMYITTLKQVNLMLEYGHTIKSPEYYMNYAVFVARQGENDRAYEWGQMAIRMAEETDDASTQSMVYNTFASQLNSLKNPRKKGFPLFEKAYKYAVKSGNQGRAAAILANSSIQTYEAGYNLKTLLNYIEDGLTYAKSINHSVVKRVLALLRQGVLNLLGQTKSPDSYDYTDEDTGESFNELETYEKMKEANFGIGLNWYYIIKMKTLFTYGEYEQAIEIQRKLDDFQGGDIEDFAIKYISMTQLFDTYSEEEQAQVISEIEKTIEDFKQNKDNVEYYKFPIAYLLIAEYHRVKGEIKPAMDTYEEALNYAIENENLMFISKIYECIALFYIKLGIVSSAKSYMTEAYRSYQEWGTDGVIDLLLKNYDNYISKDVITVGSSMDYNAATISLTTSSDNAGDMLDLSTIMKASNTISGEIELENLLEKLIKIIIENAGAQKAFIILKKDNQLLIQAQADIEHIDDVKVMLDLPVEKSELVPHSIIKYVERTQESVVLKNASKNTEYNTDSYIKNNNIISVLSLPLVNQGEFTGLLYLENNLMEGVFTPQRLELLKMLSTQMAISIRNASLYTETRIQKTTIQVYSEQLEDLVRERTAELQEANQELEVAFKEVNELKIQQDGDYYLTSVLVKPLIRNQVVSDYVNAEFHISQKKKFKFRDWEAELGGDICIADSLTLDNEDGSKSYTVFVNGDAMGKSIQGAGGALVLGVVFNAFVSRTKMVPDASNLAPEEWLIRCYRELQDVFISFSGTMMISVVMGIVDDETGMMYYFNAEHPWTVLYRDGKAEFIEEELLNHKIGLSLGDGKISLRKHQLMTNDVILSGSDGRDDIYLKEPNGELRFNRDESLFLRFVEEGKGELDKIVSLIYDRSKLRDDLSIMRIQYLGSKLYQTENEKDYENLKNEAFRLYKDKKPDKAIEKFNKALEMKKDSECFNLLLKSHIKLKHYDKALETVEEAIRYYPGDLTFIYYCGILNRKFGNYDRALYYSKRYYIHNKENIEIVLNLVEIYKHLKKYEEAERHLQEAEELNNEHKKITKLKKELERFVK